MIPRRELNGAVVNKRLTDFVQSAVTRKFERIIHLVDSSTVLGYLHKEDQRLKPYEGVRVAEIQAAGQIKDGLLQDWAWIEGEVNPADWVTKPRKSEGTGSWGLLAQENICYFESISYVVINSFFCHQIVRNSYFYQIV